MVQESSDECCCFLAFPIGIVVNASRSPKRLPTHCSSGRLMSRCM